MAFGSFSTPSVPSTVTGFNAPQQLFAGLPTGGPGMVTPNTTVSMPMAGMDIQDQATAYALAQRMKADKEAEWARATAINKARHPAQPTFRGSAGYEDPIGNLWQSNPRAYAQMTPGTGGIAGYRGPVLWAPQGMTGGALGTWSQQQQARAAREGRTPPMILQRSAEYPMPTQMAKPGQGLPMSRMGTSNPVAWALSHINK